MKWNFIAVLLSITSPSVWAQISEPAIRTCQGVQEFCLSDTVFSIDAVFSLCVKIDIEAGFSDAIDHFEIDWGDGTPLTIVPGSNNPPDQTHLYDFSDFYKTCTGELKYTIFLETFLEDGRVLNNGFRATFKNPPLAGFAEPDILCVGQEACFMNTSCENADSASYQWLVDGALVSTGLGLCYIFTEYGSHEVCLVAANACGSDTSKQSVRVRDVPRAMSDFSYLVSNGCIPDTVLLDDQSFDANTVCWEVLGPPSSGWHFVESSADLPDTAIVFDAVDTFQIRHISKNECGADTSYFDIETFGQAGVLIASLPDTACGQLLYRPDVSYSGSIDSIQWFLENNPVFPQDSFPEILLDAVGTYIVSVSVSGPCGPATASVEVVVNAMPEADLITVGPLCQGSDSIQLEVTPSNLGGTFGCSPAVTPDGIFYPALAQIGDNVICYDIPSALCPSVDTFVVVVQQEQDSVIVGSREKICFSELPYQLGFSPAGGQWSGDGITGNPEDGIFNPPTGGIFYLEYHYRDPSGCMGYKTKTIEVIDLPTASGNDVSICQADADFDLIASAGISYAPSGGELTCQVDGIQVPNCTINPSLPQWAGSSHEIIITYTIPPGCSATDSLTLEITDLEQAQAPPDTIVCQGQPLNLEGYPETCGTWSPQPLITPSGTVNTSSPVESTFTYTCNPGTACETSDETAVIVRPGPMIMIVEDWVCQSQATYTLPAGSPAGVWSGQFVQGGNIVNVAALPASGDYTYTYTVETLPDACQAVDFTLHVEPLPIAGFTHPEAGCEGAGIPFANTSTGATHYRWHSTSGCDILPATAPNATVACQAGTHTVTLEAWTLHPLTGDTLCIDTYSSIIHIIAPPQQVAFTADATEGCAPLTVHFNNLSQGDSMQYEWHFPDSPVFYGDTPTPQVFPGGDTTAIYEVTLKGWNKCDTLWDTLQITVLPQPHAGIGIQFDEPCSGGELVLSNLSTGNPADNNWTIRNITLESPPQTFNAFIPPPLTVFASDMAIALVVIELIVKNECGESIVSDTVEVQPSPYVARMSYSAARVCVGDTLLLADISTPAGTAASWEVVLSNEDTLPFYGDTLYFSPAVPGPFKVTLYADGNCGFDSEELEFEAMPLPEVSATYEPAIPCSGQPVHFEVATDGNGMRLYYGDNDFAGLNISQHTYAGGGLYPLYAYADTPFGCRGEWRDTIEVAETPVAAIAFTDNICAGMDAIFTAEGSGAQSWGWHFCDTCYMEGASVRYAFPASGTHIVQLVAVSAQGCRDSTERPFFVRPTPVAGLEAEVIEKCTPAVALLHDRSTMATGVQWLLAGQPVSMANTVEITVEEAGEQPVTLIATNGGICFDTASTSLSFFESPTLAARKEPGCSEAEGTSVLVETAEGNFVTMVGLDSDYGQPGNFHAGVPNGTYLVNAISPDGCEAELEVFVPPVQELFIHLAQYLFEIDLGQEVQLEASANQEDVGYLWAPAADLDDATVHDPIARPLISTFFAVAATNEQGCVKYDTAFVSVIIDRDKDIFVPNTFTPNNDGPNDIFRLRSANPGLSKIRSFQIFDRWGEKVFEAYDCQPETSACGWDGTFRGQKAEMGMYVWLVELEFLDSIMTKRKGEVTLLR